MSAGRHSYVPFYPSDWIAGTARMTPMQELVYFRVCCFVWDKAEPCPWAELRLLLGGVEDWDVIVGDLIAAGKLDGSPGGSVVNSRALVEAVKARELWEKRSKGGKRGAAKTNAESPDKSGDGSADETPVKSVAGTGDGPRGGDAPQNQNQNQNQNHKRGARGTRLPPDWEPDLGFASEHGVDGGREAEKFRDYWKAQPGQKGVKLDWDATWRNWIRRCAEDKQTSTDAEPAAPTIPDEERWPVVRRNIETKAVRDPGQFRYWIAPQEPVSFHPLTLKGPALPPDIQEKVKHWWGDDVVFQPTTDALDIPEYLKRESA